VRTQRHRDSCSQITTNKIPSRKEIRNKRKKLQCIDVHPARTQCVWTIPSGGVHAQQARAKNANVGKEAQTKEGAASRTHRCAIPSQHTYRHASLGGELRTSASPLSEAEAKKHKSRALQRRGVTVVAVHQIAQTHPRVR
jgi:hypothetical protein